MFHVQSPGLLGTQLLQRPCHELMRAVLLGTAVAAGLMSPVYGAPPAHNYPTQARVEYVNAWRLILRDSVWAIPGVQDVTERIRAVAGATEAADRGGP